MQKSNSNGMQSILRSLTLLLALTTIAACSDSSDRQAGGGNVALGEFVLAVLSSPPDQVSGGDARISVELPDGLAPEEVEIALDGVDVRSSFSTMGGDMRLEGLVSGLGQGENIITVNSTGGQAPQAELVLTNHPSSGPIFSGEQQQPFFCSTDGEDRKSVV